nr:amidohydrolase [Acinetobacter gyllenbergii]
MQGDTPNYVEALLIKDGYIQFAGNLDEAKKQSNKATPSLDLKNQTLIPSFIDAHSHVTAIGLQEFTAKLYPPPDGSVSDIKTLIQTMKYWSNKNQKLINSMDGWIVGLGYDDSQLFEKRHPTAEELDQISKSNPVFLLHQSGHIVALNTKALELLKIDENTKDPDGGIIVRIQNSLKPNGILEEEAATEAKSHLLEHIPLMTKLKIPKIAFQKYIENGFTTVQEGRANIDTTRLLKIYSKLNQLDIDVVVYPDIISSKEYMLKSGSSLNYDKHFRIGGVKISLDGSPQGKTAWLTKPYLIPPKGLSPDYLGYPAFPDSNKVQEAINLAYQNNWQVIAHANGDAAIDQYLNAIEYANKKFGENNRRNVIIHAQTIRDDQLDRAKELGVIPSFFSAHTFYWGDWHKNETLGLERASKISPANSALNKGILFTQHHDAPIVPPSAIRVLDSTVNRKTRSGIILGENERVSPYIALKSLTHWAAYQYSEEKYKGTLEKGKKADLVILDKNPLTIPKDQIINIKIVATYKNGRKLYPPNSN